VRPLSDAERQQLEAGLRSSNAFVPSASSGQALRRCQVLVSSARGEMAPQIARHLGCNDQTVRNAIGAFNHAGLASLSKGSSRPPTTRAAFPGEKAEQLRALLHQSPRTFHQPTNLWTPELAAEVSFQQGLTPRGSVERPSGPPWPAWGCAGSGPKGGSPAPTQHMAEKRGSRPADPPGSHPP
jgi:transposase